MTANAEPMRGRARHEIVRAATEEFTAHGIRAVSAERIAATAGVSKMTFYRHFPTKDDLVVAYLEHEFDAVRAAIEEPGPAGLDQWSDVLTREICRPGFRGCPFINAAAEYPDAEHPVRAVVTRFRTWMIATIAAALEGTVGDTHTLARQVMMLRDGALVEGYVDGDAGRVAAELADAVAGLVASARVSAAS